MAISSILGGLADGVKARLRRVGTWRQPHMAPHNCPEWWKRDLDQERAVLESVAMYLRFALCVVLLTLVPAAYSQNAGRGGQGANWIAVPDAPARDYGVYHFRRTFDLPAKPSCFILRVSADNRYKLYVNGRQAALGPARGDLLNWRYETVDIAGDLRAGKNVLAAAVWNFAD
jgi:hypothetical protein